MDELHTRVATRIRELADARGIALTHVADRAGVGRAHLWNVLEGRQSPTLRWLAKIATALDVPVEDLVSGTTRREPG